MWIELRHVAESYELKMRLKLIWKSGPSLVVRQGIFLEKF